VPRSSCQKQISGLRTSRCGLVLQARVILLALSASLSGPRLKLSGIRGRPNNPQAYSIRQLTEGKSYRSRWETSPQIAFSEKFLTGSMVLSYTRQFTRRHDRARWGRNFNDDEQDIQRTRSQMAAVGRHAWRVSMDRSELVTRQYF